MRPYLLWIKRGRKPRTNNNAVIPVGAILILLALAIIAISIRFILPPFTYRSLGALAPAPHKYVGDAHE
ncbi:MAG: hypothetical protein MJA82_10900 [Clostridia bacterium]|nr:hypothetical protein [Clostridia bacterium]